MSIELEPLLEELYSLSLSLQDLVSQHDPENEEDPEKWIGLLDQRQDIIDQLANMTAQGIIISDVQKKQYLEKIYLIDQQVVPVIKDKMDYIQSQLTNMKKSKRVNLQYTGYNVPDAYGAFFDKRK